MKAEDRLQQEIAQRKRVEEAYRTLVDHSLQGLVIFQDGRIVFANQALAEMTGHAVEELLALSPKEVQAVVHPDDGVLVWSRHRDRLSGKDVPDRYEFRGIRKDGTPFWVEMHASLVEYEGRPAVQAAFIDITERKQAEEALQESEQRYRNLVERANDGVAIVQDAVVRYANQRAAGMIGATVEEVVGTPFVEHVHPDQVPELADRYERRMAGEEVVPVYETVLMARDGAQVHVEISAGLTTYHGKPADLAIIRDITERKRAEEALRESEERYRNLVERANDGIAIVQDGRFKYVNPRTAEISGYTVEEMIDTPFASYVHPDEVPKLTDRYERRMAGEDIASTYETVIRRKDGSDVHIEINAGLITYEGKPADLAFGRDITERKQAEIVLRESEERFRQTAELSPLPVCIISPAGQYEYLNPKFTEVFGYTLEDIPDGEAWFARAYPDGAYRKEAMSAWLSDLEESGTYEVRPRTFSVTCKDGTIREVLFRPVTVKDGRQFVIHEDITERQRAEQALKESEEKFRNLAEQSPNMIFINKMGRVVYANEKCEEVTGYTRDELYSPDFEFLTLIAPEHKELVRAGFSKHLRGEEVEPYEYALVTKDGDTTDAIITTRLTEYEGERAILGIVTDITERKRAEEEIRRHTAQLAALREVGLDLSSQLDVDALLHSIVSRALELLRGTSGGMYLYRPDRDVLEWAVAVGSHLAPAGTVLHRGEGLSGKVWEIGEPLIVDDYEHWEGRGAVYEGYPFAAVVGAPVYWGEEFLGVLNVLADPPRTFSAGDAELLSLFATQAAIAIHNARLYEDARARSRYLETLQQINVTLRTTLPLSQVLETITQGAGEALGYVGSLIVTPDASGERLVLGGAWGSRFLDAAVKVTGLDVGSFNLPLAAEENPIVQAFLTGELQAWIGTPERIVTGVEPAISPKLAPAIAQLMGAVAAACIPLRSGESVSGVLVVFSPREQPADREVDMLVGLADQAGLAIETARLYAEAQRRAKELATLGKTGQALTSTLDLEEVLTQALAEVRALLGAEAASVLLHDAASDELVFAAAVGSGAESLAGIRMPATEGIAGWALREARPVLVGDAQDDPRFYDRVDAMTGLTTRSLLAVPLTCKGNVIGVIEAINRADKAFDKHDLDLLSTLAGSAAIAIENARLYEETAHRLAETRVLQEVMLAAASTLDFDQVLTRAILAIHRTLGIEHLALALPDESREYLVPHPSLIGYESMPEEGVRLPLDESVCGRVFTTGAAELVHDTSEIPSHFQSIGGLRSTLTVPVELGDSVIAVLTAESPRPAAFTEDDLRTFEAIAAQLATVMENARLYEVEREQRKLVEQSQAQLVQSEKLAATGRLAASLAHEINNPLQTIHSSLQLILTFPLEAGEQRECIQTADEEVGRLMDMVTRILDFARRPQREKEPTDVNEVIERVLALSGKYLQHRHIVLRRDLARDLPPTMAAPDELGQVFLNLVLNAVDAMPGGGALRVSSRLGEDGRMAVLFSDTGRGIAPEHLARIFEPFFSTKEQGTGLGLSVSRSVTERHGGEMTVESVVGQGTTFTVWLPVLREDDVT